LQSLERAAIRLAVAKDLSHRERSRFYRSPELCQPQGVDLPVAAREAEADLYRARGQVGGERDELNLSGDGTGFGKRARFPPTGPREHRDVDVAERVADPFDRLKNLLVALLELGHPITGLSPEVGEGLVEEKGVEQRVAGGDHQAGASGDRGEGELDGLA